jgi:hypothetical protein
MRPAPRPHDDCAFHPRDDRVLRPRHRLHDDRALRPRDDRILRLRDDRALWPRDHRRAGDDRGTVAMFTSIFALFVIVLAGLLVDGGQAIHARQRAADIAEQGARAAADDVDVAYLRSTGKVRIADERTACLRARRLIGEYPEVTGVPKCAIRGGQEARVSVQITVRLQLLSIVPGFGDFTMNSTASARPQEGI